jgi:hypothetical protein
MNAAQVSDVITSVEVFKATLQNADHIDVKAIEGDVSLRQFIAGMLNYSPAWIRALYGIRWGFVRLLGMKQEGVPDSMGMRPEDVPMTAGQKAGFFTVDAAADSHYYLVSASESHLTAWLGVVMEPLTDGRSRFHVITIVHYNNAAGPVYFNVIRPFHHLVVARMMKAGIKLPESIQASAA